MQYLLVLVFSNRSFKFQSKGYNRCHNLLMMSTNFSAIAILSLKGFDYHCITSGINKNEAINLLQNANLTKKGEH